MEGIEEDWVEGETAPRDYTLEEFNKSTSLWAAKDLTGLAVEMVLTDRNGTAVPMTGDVAVITPAAGLVRVTPDSTDLTVAGSPLKARFKVIDGSSGIGYFPRGDAMVWRVWKP